LDGLVAVRPLHEEAKGKCAAFQPANALVPNWGEGQLLGRLKQYEVAALAAQ
jgi:hypothetical protein